MRLYVAGPMRGIPEKNIPAFNAAADELRLRGYDVVNPARHDDTPGMVYAWYLQRALQDLVQDGIDGLALLDRWQNSEGAQLEVQIARMLKLPCMPYAAWVHRAEVVHLLRDTYDPEDIERWLDAHNQNLDGYSPLYLLRGGAHAMVLEEARKIAGVPWPPRV